MGVCQFVARAHAHVCSSLCNQERAASLTYVKKIDGLINRSNRFKSIYLSLGAEIFILSITNLAPLHDSCMPAYVIFSIDNTGAAGGV